MAGRQHPAGSDRLGASHMKSERRGTVRPPRDRFKRPQPQEGNPGPRDAIFARALPRISDFHFGKETATVFDDMLPRSVPFYLEIQRMIGELVGDFAAPGTAIYDLGCSTATTFLEIAKTLPPDRDMSFVGIDSSEEMLGIAREKLTEGAFPWPFELRTGDMNQGIEVHNASVVLMVLTLQFIRPLYRERLVRSIYEGLTDNGCVILVEKVLAEDSTFNRLFIQHYYEMKKRNGYSDLEIAQKREALENVLVPYRLEENQDLLRRQGFRAVDVFFKWYNFCGIVARK
jgi:tRNA (cmo5U34)-methyltransferase